MSFANACKPAVVLCTDGNLLLGTASPCEYTFKYLHKWEQEVAQHM